MFNIDTILSSFDCKGTLLKWLKKIVTLLENESLTDVQIKAVADGKAQMILTFEDGSIQASNIFDLPQGPTGATGAQGPKGDTGDGFNNLASMVIATANGLVSADDGFHVAVETQFKAANGDLIASATGSYTIPIEGSQTVVCDIDETNHKINIHLDATYKNKIDKALQLPQTAPSATQIVAVGTNNAQTMLGIGDGLSVVSGKLTAGSGKRYLNIMYLMFENNADGEHIRFEPNKVYAFFNFDTQDYETQYALGDFAFNNIQPMQWYGGDKPVFYDFTTENVLYRPNYLRFDIENEAFYMSLLSQDTSIAIPRDAFGMQEFLAIDYQSQIGNLVYFLKSIEVR